MKQELSYSFDQMNESYRENDKKDMIASIRWANQQKRLTLLNLA
jgi:hypothetical protein